jgi:hypothetical protein
LKSYLYLLAAIFIAFGGWAASAQTWSQLLSIGMLPIFIGSLGSIIVAWLGQSPVKANNGQIAPKP